MKLLSILQQSVILILKSGSVKGTGFYFTPNLIITCKHVLDLNSEIHIQKDNGKICKASVYKDLSNDNYDITILHTNEPSSDFVLLGLDFEINDPLYGYGYSLSTQGLDSVTLTIEGKSDTKSFGKLLKVKNGQVVKGMSGSPILNPNTDEVVGILLLSRNIKSELGGFILPISSLITLLTHEFAKDRSLHLEYYHWLNNSNLHNTGIGTLDQSFRISAHFKIFHKSPISINDIYIEPSYNLVEINNSGISELIKTDFITDARNILTNEKILLISGPYGSGKTFLTKYLQRSLFINGYNTIYINAVDLIEYTSYESLLTSVLKRKSSFESIYIFVDAFDDLISLSKEGTNLNSTLSQYIFRLSCEKNIFVILNNRILSKSIGSQTVYDEYYTLISLLIAEFQKKHSITIITTDYFQKHQIEEWISTYGDLVSSSKSYPRLQLDDIYKAHKHFITAVKNPLLLYMVNQYYYTNFTQKPTIKNIYNIYEQFVKSTSSGKFSEERAFGHNTIEQLKQKYHVFLKQVAKKIAAETNSFNLTEKGSDEDYIFDKNEELYGISNKSVANDIEDILKTISVKADLHFEHEKIEEKILNCYFFELSGNYWKFRDNNVLFYLLAESVNDSFEKALLLLTTGKGIGDCFKPIQENSNIRLHPVIIELLLNKINSYKTENKKSLFYLLDKFIEEEYFLSISSSSEKAVFSWEKINLDILLCIIYIHLNVSGYSKFPFFFKRFTWLLSISKRINKDVFFLGKRFFKESKIKNAEFRRVNLKGYNFDESVLENVRFIQTKFDSVRKNSSELIGVHYLLCDLRDTEMNNIKGDLVFESCQINSLKMDDPRLDLKVRFSRCYIHSLEIHSSITQKNGVFLSFNNCEIKTIIFKRSLAIEFELLNNEIQKIKLEKSRITIKTTNDIEKIKKCLDCDKTSQIEFSN